MSQVCLVDAMNKVVIVALSGRWQGFIDSQVTITVLIKPSGMLQIS